MVYSSMEEYLGCKGTMSCKGSCFGKILTVESVIKRNFIVNWCCMSKSSGDTLERWSLYCYTAQFREACDHLVFSFFV
jgi:hypothetical protein